MLTLWGYFEPLVKSIFGSRGGVAEVARPQQPERRKPKRRGGTVGGTRREETGAVAGSLFVAAPTAVEAGRARPGADVIPTVPRVKVPALEDARGPVARRMQEFGQGTLPATPAQRDRALDKASRSERPSTAVTPNRLSIAAPRREETIEPLPSGATPDETMDERYERITREMLAQFEVKVRKWRTSMSGMAWELRYRDGSIKRMIESPKPCGPMSAAVFLHEIGHHAIGFNRYKPRCLEEYHAWAWSIAAMQRCGLNVTDAVRRRMHESLWYAVAKARRRGMKELPVELVPYQDRPPRKNKAKRVADQPVIVARAASPSLSSGLRG